MKFDYVCKPVCCEHNLPVEATYIHVTKLGRKGSMTCFTKAMFLRDYLAKPMGSSVFTEL